MRASHASARASGAPLWLATWGGTGLLPWAPGTFAALTALPLAWLLTAAGGVWLLLTAALAVFVLGIWAAERYMAAVGIHDPTAVVIDEIAGQWLTLCVAPLEPVAYLVGFVLFRIFDVLKPWPASWLDRRVGGAFGVMIDDIAAAAYAGGALAVLVTWFLP